MREKPAEFANADTAAEDTCIIAFTSGTTGKPKGTMHFHRDVMAICDCFPRSTLQPSRDDIFCGTPPLAFTFGLGSSLPANGKGDSVTASRTADGRDEFEYLGVRYRRSGR